MLVSLTVGDWPGEGHGKTTSYLYNVEGLQSFKELVTHYESGCSKLGYDLHEECTDDEEFGLTPKFIEALNASSIPVPEDMDTRAFAELYLQIALLSIPSLMWSRIEGVNIDIGGYGLFYH